MLELKKYFMKKIFLASVILLGLLFTFQSGAQVAQGNNSSPKMSMDQYSKKITQRINKNFKLTQSQQNQVRLIVSKYGEVPAGKDVYSINTAAEREILEILNPTQMMTYKQSHSLFVLPAAQSKPIHKAPANSSVK